MIQVQFGNDMMDVSGVDKDELRALYDHPHKEVLFFLIRVKLKTLSQELRDMVHAKSYPEASEIESYMRALEDVVELFDTPPSSLRES